MCIRDSGIAVLALDLRGHGESAPELAERVRERDGELFRAMHADVAAAVEFLRSRGADTTRVAVLGASVGCSVAVDAAVRDPSAFRSLALMTPGAAYLGVDTLEHLQRWPGLPALVLTSTEEQASVDRVAGPLAAAAPAVTRHEVFEGAGLHGTRMLGRVPGVEERLVAFFRETLVRPDLTVPSFAEDDERVETAGFVRETRRVSRTRTMPQPDGPDATAVEETFILMAFAVGDVLTLGAMTRQPFAGTVHLELGAARLSFDWDTETRDAVSVAVAGSEALAALSLKGQRASFRGTHWVNLELPVADAWTGDAVPLLSLIHI